MKRSIITARKPEERPRQNATVNSGDYSGERDGNGRFVKGHPYRWKPGQSGNPLGGKLHKLKTHDELRALIQQIADEPIGVGPNPNMPRLQLMLRSMVTSKSAADHAAFLEHGFGKVPQPYTVEPSEAALRLMRELGLTIEDVKSDSLAVEWLRAAGVDVGAVAESTATNRRSEANRAIVDSAASATQDAA